MQRSVLGSGCPGATGRESAPRRKARPSVLRSKTLPQGGFIPPEEVGRMGPPRDGTSRGARLDMVEKLKSYL